MARCDCDPGEEANGWHETRCRECADADLAAWAAATDRFKAWEGIRP